MKSENENSEPSTVEQLSPAAERDPAGTVNNEFSAKLESNGSSSSEDGNEPAAFQSLEIEPAGPQKQTQRKATGPRTELGKQRSSRNATTHGASSQILLLAGESPAEYRKLLTGLRKAYRPEGAEETRVVAELAFIEICKRRLRLAEWAETRKQMELFEWDQRIPSPEEPRPLEEVLDSVSNQCLIQRISEPYVLNRCIETLSEFRTQIEEHGFSPKRDKEILEKIYGCRDSDLLRDDLYDCYEAWQYTAEASEAERERAGYASPAQCIANVIREIRKEIHRLKRYQQEQTSIEAKRTQLEILSRSVPEGPSLDRFIRQEARLGRASDRARHELEDLQRARLGKPLLPEIKLRHCRD